MKPVAARPVRATTSSFFDELANRYAPQARYPGRVLDTAITLLLRSLPPGGTEILDIGCGDGFPAKKILTKGNLLRVKLLDSSEGMLAAARRRIGRNPRAEFIQGDLNHLDLPPSSFDAVWACCSFHFAARPEQLLQTLKQLLRPDGIVCLVFVAREDLEVQLFHQFFPSLHKIDLNRHCSRTETKALIRRAGFKVVRAEIIPYKVKFPTQKAFIRFVGSKPFSGFALMSPEAFRRGFAKFASKVIAELPRRNISSKGLMSVVIGKRYGS